MMKKKIIIGLKNGTLAVMSGGKGRSYRAKKIEKIPRSDTFLNFFVSKALLCGWKKMNNLQIFKNFPAFRTGSLLKQDFFNFYQPKGLTMSSLI